MAPVFMSENEFKKEQGECEGRVSWQGPCLQWKWKTKLPVRVHD